MNISALSSISMTAVRTGGANLDASVTGADVGPASVTSISDAGKRLSDLASLRDSDPQKFQTTMTAMAENLRSEAKTQSGQAADFLNGMADKISAAAKSGDLSALKPPSGGPPMGMRCEFQEI